MAEDLFRVFKSVRKLVREKTEDLFGNVSPLERTLREVLDEESCAVSNTLLRHLALSTNDAYAYAVVAPAVWQGIASEFWQRIYKCLCLLEFMILLGPERCRLDCANAQMTIRSLTQYRFHDGRREQGGGVRQKAENILLLVNDAEYWRASKDQAVQDTEKYASGIENQMYSPPAVFVGLHTRASNPFFSGPEALPPFALRPTGPLGGSPPNPFAAAPASAAFYAPQSRVPPPSGGLYDPGEDFNTSNPFAGLPTAASKSASEQPSAGTAPATETSAARPKNTGSLLDDEFFSQPSAAPAPLPATAPAPATKKPVNLLPDLLD